MVTQMTSHIFIFNVNKQILDLLFGASLLFSNTKNNFCNLYFFHVSVVVVNFTQQKLRNTIEI